MRTLNEVMLALRQAHEHVQEAIGERDAQLDALTLMRDAEWRSPQYREAELRYDRAHDQVTAALWFMHGAVAWCLDETREAAR